MQQSVSQLRQRLLENRLTPRYEPEVLRQMDHVNPLKTNSMLAMEYKHGELIEVLIAYPQPLRDVARRLGVSDATISKWRLALGLRRPGIASLNHDHSMLNLTPSKVLYKHGRCKVCGKHWATRHHKKFCLQKDVSGTSGVS